MQNVRQSRLPRHVRGSNRFMASVVALLVTVCSFSAKASGSRLTAGPPAQSSVTNRGTRAGREPRTVLDYYALLPARYIAALKDVKNRESLIAIRDIPNGYLRLAPREAMIDWEGWAEVALFKRTDGSYIVGVVDAQCATICYSGVEFLQYRAGAWTEVTRQVLPEITDKMVLTEYRRRQPDDERDERDAPFINYVLPRRGTTLRVNANTGGDRDTFLFELRWNGERFELASAK